MATETIEELPYKAKEDCPVCKGSGFSHPLNDEGKPDYSRVVYCTQRGCMLDSVKEYLSSQQEPQTFDNFKAVAGTKEALKYAKKMASGEAEFVWLLMYGGVGCGKSHLCKAILSGVRERGIRCSMILAAEMFANLREMIQTNETETELRRLKDIPFLIIDDLGVEYNSEWEQAKLDELMTSRFMNLRHTVLVTNKDESALPERIRSRFGDTKIARSVYNSAGDYRGKK